MRFSVLGPVAVLRDGGDVRLGPLRERTVLALLVADANLMVSRDRLVDELWAGRPPPRAVETLRVYVSNLRRRLEPDRRVGVRDGAIATRPGGYVLQASTGAVDACRFETLAEEGRRALDEGDAGAAQERLREALRLWRGRAFADVEHTERIALEAARLEELRVDVLEGRLAAAVALGRLGEVVAEAEALVAAHPFREGLWRQLIVALYRSGRQGDALAAYRRLRTVLAEELGVEPSRELQRLQERVLAQDPTLEAPRRPRHNLPAPVSSFVGRASELARLAELVAGSRLVTLVGAGGSGKTRLALEVAARAAAGFADGCWLVDLAGVSRPREVVPTLAATVGLRGVPEPQLDEALVRWLSGRTVLLVVDNCEHLAVECAALVMRLLHAGPGLSVLATSRQALGLTGEIVFEVPPLSLPDPTASGDPIALLDSDAVRLLVERGRCAAPGFAVTDGNAATLAEIVRRLDGLPLAIELAARRLRSLSPADLAARLGDRLHLLVGGVSALPRHRTLRATLEWSYDLLADAEARLLRRLWVFNAPFDTASAEAVCADDALPAARIPDLLAGLVDRSLLVAERGEHTRFRMLETVREYAHERALDHEDVERLRRRHRDTFLALAEQAAARLHGPDALAALHGLEVVHVDLRRALDWSLNRPGEYDAALRLGAALSWYWVTQGHVPEGVEQLERLVAAASLAPSAALVDCLVGLCHLAGLNGTSTVERGHDAIVLASQLREPRAEAEARRMLMLALTWDRRYKHAIAAAARSLSR